MLSLLFTLFVCCMVIVVVNNTNNLRAAAAFVAPKALYAFKAPFGADAIKLKCSVKDHLGKNGAYREGYSYDGSTFSCLPTDEKMYEEQQKMKKALKQQKVKWQRKEIHSQEKYRLKYIELAKDKKTGTVKPTEDKWILTGSSEFLRHMNKIFGYNKAEVAVGKTHLVSNIVKICLSSNATMPKRYRRVYANADFTQIYLLSKGQPKRKAIFSDVWTAPVNCFTNITTGEVLEDLEGLTEYVAIGGSPSDNKKGASYYVPANDKHVYEALNSASHGVLEELTKVKGYGKADLTKATVRIFQCLTASKVIGKVNNFALYNGIVGDHVGSRLEEEFLEIIKKSLLADLNEKLEETNKKAYAEMHLADLLEQDKIIELMDKSFYKLIKKIADKFASFEGTADGLGLILDGLLLCAKSAQARPMSCKAYFVAVKKSLLYVLMNKLDRSPINLYSDTITTEEKELFRTMFDKSVENHPWAGKIVTYTTDKSKPIQLFGDMNTFKAPFTLTEDGFDLPVMDYPMATKSHYSMQMISKVLEVSPMMVQYFAKMALKEIKQTMKDYKEGNTVGISSMKSFYAAGTISKLQPNHMRNDRAMRKGQLRNVTNSFMQIINRAHIVAEDSVNQRALPDIGVFFGTRFIAKDEIVTKDVKEGTKVMVVKYPSMSAREFFILKVVSPRTICNKRIMADDTLTLEEKRALCSYYKELNKGSAILPNSIALMAMLAGMDFDYDAIVLFYDEKIVKAMEGVKPEVVNIRKNKADNSGNFKITKETLDVLAEPIFIKMEANVGTVGSVTTNFDVPKQLGLLFDLAEERGDTKEMERLCTLLTALLDRCIGRLSETPQVRERALTAIQEGKESIKIEGTFNELKTLFSQKIPKPLFNRTGEYKGLDITEGKEQDFVSCSEDDKTRIRKELLVCTITTNNFKKIIRDIQVISHHDQEITIDYDKTGVPAEEFANFTQVCMLFSSVQYVYTINQDDVLVREYKTKDGAQAVMNKYTLVDIFSEYRELVAERMEKVLQEELEREVDWNVLDNLISAYVDGLMNTRERSVMHSMCKIYARIAKSNHAVREEAEKLLDENANKNGKAVLFYEGIRSTLNPFLENRDADERARLALIVSMFTYFKGVLTYRTTKTGERVKNGFDFSIFPRELTNLACINADGETFVAEPLAAVATLLVEHNMELTFHNGVCIENALILAVANEQISGTFYARMINDKWYAIDEMSNYLNVDDVNTDLRITMTTGDKPKVGTIVELCTKELEIGGKNYVAEGLGSEEVFYPIHIDAKEFNCTLKGASFEVIDVIPDYQYANLWHVLVSKVGGEYVYDNSLTVVQTQEQCKRALDLEKNLITTDNSATTTTTAEDYIDIDAFLDTPTSEEEEVAEMDKYLDSEEEEYEEVKGVEQCSPLFSLGEDDE